MSNVIEKAIKAGDLPPQLRGNIDKDASVLVSVRRLTDNGFTEGTPFRRAREVIEELKALAAKEASALVGSSSSPMPSLFLRTPVSASR